MAGIRVRGVRRVSAKMRKLAKVHPTITTSVLIKWGTQTVGKLKSKAEPPPLPTYTRTGRMKKSWQLGKMGAAKIAIKNIVRRKGKPYARYPLGDSEGKGQVQVHQNRWWIARDEVEAEIPELFSMLSAAIRKLIKR